MTKARCIKTIEHPEGKACVSIFERGDGMYEFVVEGEQEDLGQVYWAPIGGSGLHDTAESAEREARATITWLKDQNPD